MNRSGTENKRERLRERMGDDKREREAVRREK